MKIAFNPSTVAALTSPPDNKDIIFDLRGHNIFARGVKFYGTDTNTWRDIKINNVSIGSHTLDLRNGSNTTLTNTNGVVTINSTQRPVVDNLTSNSTTSSLSANQGRVLKALIDGKSDSGHNHDSRYVRYYAVTTLDCNNLAVGLTAARVSATNAAHTNNSVYLYISDIGTPFQIQIPDSNVPYIYKRYYSSGKWSGWFKLNAGYADSAGSVAWANITGKPSSYTPSAHTHAWNSLTHSSTTENQAILTNGKANGWKLYTLNISGWNNAANNAHSHSNKSVLDGITSGLVNNWNTAYNFVHTITGTDTDKVINKWDEIVNFLAGITEDNKLNTLLNSKLSVYELADKTNVGTIKNNGIYYSTTEASTGTLTNSPFTNDFALINMTNLNNNEDQLRRCRLAFSRVGDIKVSDDHLDDGTAETWYNVLTSKNSGIDGSTIKLNGTSITVYSSGTADGRYVKKSGDTMTGVLTIDTTNFGTLTIKRNDDANGASIQFRGKSSVYGYIGLNNSTKDKQFLRWNSDISKVYTILDTSSTYTSSGKGVINGTTITQVDNATNATNSTNARKLVNWYSSRPTSLNAQFGDGSLRIFYATSSTTVGKCPADATVLHLAWDNNDGWDSQLAVGPSSNRIYSRSQNNGTWQSWKTVAFTTDIPNKNSWNYDDRYYTKAESNAKYITDITTSVNKLTFTKNGSSIARTITVNNVQSLGRRNPLTERNAISGIYTYGTYSATDNLAPTNYLETLGFGEGAAGTIEIGGSWISGGQLYWRALRDYQENWFSWKIILDSSNYSSILDSRYYTESEVNSLLSKKLDRVNLSVGSWNPRGYSLAADYHYNGGDLSISENGGKMYVSIDGQFYQNEGKYRVLDTSDIGSIRGGLTLYQYLSATDANWYPLVLGGSDHKNTNNSTGSLYKSYDKLSWQTSSQTLYATNIQTENIKHLSIEGGIYWNPNVESATDGTDAASITLVRAGVAGGTTLVLSQMNEANDTIQFKTSTAAKLYHNSYPILTTQNTYVNNHKGYIYGTEITQVNNSDTVDGWHKDEINRTLFITSSTHGLSSYWAKLWEINLNNQYNDVTITFLAAASYYPSYFAIFSIYLRQNGSGTTKDISARIIELIGNIAIGDTDLRLYVNNTTGNCQLWGNVKGQYGTLNLSVLKKAWRIATDSSNIGTFFSTEFSSVQSLPGDGWNKIGVTQQVLTGTFNPSSHTHTWTSITDKIVAGNEFNIVNAGFKEDLWFNYLPINDRSKSATISSYCFGNGNKEYTAVKASGFMINGGTSQQLLRADGGVADFNWFGQSGQPIWLWGGNDFNSYYVYNPSNFRVAYASSAGNAETLGGFSINYGQVPFGTIPCIKNDGVMEIGRYIDYHYDNSGKYDFSTRLQTTGNYANVVNLPSASGTLALISQVLTWKSQIIDMRSYNESYWHPVTVPLPYTGYNKIKVSVQLNSGDKPSWAIHRDGITCNMEIWATASGWGTTDSDTICLNYTYKYCSQNPCGWMQLGYPSLGVVFLRGGSRYTVYTDFDATFTPHNQKYIWSSGSYSQDTGGPYTSCPGLNFNMGAIRADLIATMVQARRVCAGHDPGIDNSISCSNWFRSSGNTGWYNTTYQGGWYMSDTSWIRAHNNVGIYTGGQIYSSSSIKMGNILLEHTDEINNITNGGINLNYRNSGNISLCQGGGRVGIGTMSPTYKLDVDGHTLASGFIHRNHQSDDAVLLAGGSYKTLNSIYGGDINHPVFLGYLNLDHGNDGTVSSSFSCLGYSVPFTYTRGGNYCRITIPDTTYQVFYIKAATASVNYSGGGMDTWVGYHRGSGAWWLHCYASGTNEIRVKGFRQSDDSNDSWWGGNPLWSYNDGANKITVCIFGYVKFR